MKKAASSTDEAAFLPDMIYFFSAFSRSSFSWMARMA